MKRSHDDRCHNPCEGERVHLASSGIRCATTNIKSADKEVFYLGGELLIDCLEDEIAEVQQARVLVMAM